MKSRWFLVVALLLAVGACGHRNQVKRPEVFLDEPLMIDVMTDAYLIEAMLNTMKSEGDQVDTLQAVYYQQFFEHYGITDSIFEANMNYYTHHPDILERIMDSVNNRFVSAQQ